METSSPAKRSDVLPPWLREPSPEWLRAAQDRIRKSSHIESARKKLALSYAMESAGLAQDSFFATATFDGYKKMVAEWTTGHEAAVQSCRKAIAGSKGVVLFGPTGVGKTYLLSAMVREAILSGGTAHILPAERFFFDLRKCMDSSKTSESEYLGSLEKPQLLVIDDLHNLAAQKASGEESYQYRALWTLLDGRYRHGKTTCSATNRERSEFAGMLDERMRRRFMAIAVHVPPLGK